MQIAAEPLYNTRENMKNPVSEGVQLRV